MKQSVTGIRRAIEKGETTPQEAIRAALDAIDEKDAEIGAFVEAIEQGTEPVITFEDGRQALVLAEAAIRSAAEGRTVPTREIG